MKFTDPILILGAGSIGERHIAILQKLSYNNIWVYRQRNLPFLTIEQDTVSIFTDLSKIKLINPFAAIICTPTSQHLEQALFCVERNIPVLVEKPLSGNLAGLEELKRSVLRNKTYVQVAYMLRYHPYFQRIKTTIDSGDLGKLVSIQSNWSEYLPDWHPYENYRESYASRKELGGGAALTLSHDIDLLNWLAHSPVENWHTRKNYTAMPEIDVESAADISIHYKNGVTAKCHLDFHSRTAKRWYRFVFEEGYMEVDYLKSELTTCFRRTISTESLVEFDRNQLYTAQILNFFAQIEDKNVVKNALKFIQESETILSICQ